MSWFRELSLHRRLEQLQKNLLLGFIDGIVVAELIAATYPRLVAVHNYKETSSAAVRLQNWTMLNKKVLATIKCELGEQDISKIASRNIQRTAVITFLRLLRTKLRENDATYSSEQSTIAHQQKMATSKLTRGKTSTSKYNTGGPIRRVTHAFGIRSLNSSSAEDTDGPPPDARPALAKSLAILRAKEDVKGVKEKVKKMTEEDVDAMYEEFASKMSDKLSNETLEANEMLHKSLAIEHHLLALKEQNLVDLAETDVNLRQLHYELNHINEITTKKADKQASDDLEEGLRAEAERKASSTTKPASAVSRRSSAISESIFRMIPESKKEKLVNKKLEKEISRRQSKCLVKMGLGAMMIDPDSPRKTVRINTKHIDSNNIFDASGDVREDIEDAVALELDDLKVEATHRRVYDDKTERHFYVEIASGQSSWTSPTEGIIKCVDDRSGKAFYTNAETKATAWSLEEVLP